MIIQTFFVIIPDAEDKIVMSFNGALDPFPNTVLGHPYMIHLIALSIDKMATSPCRSIASAGAIPREAR